MAYMQCANLKHLFTVVFTWVFHLGRRAPPASIVAGLVLSIAGCASNGAAPPTSPSNEGAPPMKAQAEPYLIGIGDTIAINVWRNPELSQSIIVRPDGYISMPLMGDVLANGESPEQLADTIDRALQSVIRSPEVTVMVTNPASAEYLNLVRVTGEVNSPVSISYKQGMRVMDVVLRAGGVSEYGAASRARLNRRVNGEYRAFNVDLKAIFDDGDMSTNYLLQVDDVITVPEKSAWRGEF